MTATDVRDRLTGAASHPKWGDSGTHCVVCTRRFATDQDVTRHEGVLCTEPACWCAQLCWVASGGECVAPEGYSSEVELYQAVRLLADQTHATGAQNRLEAACQAAARRFDWVGLESNMEASCQCGMSADELWGAEGASPDGDRPTYDPTTRPCPACVAAVRPFVEAALAAMPATPQ